MKKDFIEIIKDPLSTGIILTLASTIILYFTNFTRVFFIIYFSPLIFDLVHNLILPGGDGYAKVGWDNRFQTKGTAFFVFYILTGVLTVFVESVVNQIFSNLGLVTKSIEGAFGISFFMVLGLYLKVDQQYFKRK